MYGQISTLAFVGIEARPVEVQVRITPGRTAFVIVGLPDKAVAESCERVRNALHAVGLGMPYRHVTVNLAPADLPKEGSQFDLPIVLAMMVAMEAIAPDAVAGYAAIGELALDGSIRTVPGALPAAIGANAMGKGLICPAASGSEAAWAGEDVDILAAPHLLSLVNHFKGLQMLARRKPNVDREARAAARPARRKGQETAKRVLEVAAAGGHNLLMIGPPGAGKSMLAARLPQSSLAGELLFLDELPEFQPGVLDALRQPLETGETVIARANHRIAYPSRIQLVAAMNPCKCGNGGPGASCKRGPRCASDYQARISGPLLDRIDLQIEVPALSAADLVLPSPSEGSAEVRARVSRARELQRRRFVALGARAMRTNADCSGRVLEEIATPDADGVALLRQAADTLHLSARGFHRTLRVARTLADLDGAEKVGRMHVAEALSNRGETLRQEKAA